jgi:hypothetical protein
MTYRARSFGATARVIAAVALLFGFGQAGCSSDPSTTPPQAVSGAGGADAGEPGTQAGEAGEKPIQTGGSAGGTAVPPGDLVCKTDDDCSDADKPVCDQVLGCVACQYDWDCPADHRCKANECFEKQPCEGSGDCDAAYPVCDAVQQLCVGCREDADCGEGERCENDECVAFEACTNSRSCSDGKVCDRALGACVACVVDGDCGAGNACVHDACVPTCNSDKDCLGIGLLCDQQVGRCVECLGHADCPAQYFCGADRHCTLDVCEPTQARCETEHQLGTCTEVGDAFTSSSCSGDTRCVEDGQTASCVPLTCSPGSTRCTADAAGLEHCSADGLTIESVEACPNGQACNAGACAEVVCAPNAPVCKGNALYTCNASGTSSSFTQSCTGAFGGTCDQASGTCKPQTCSPGVPMCDGTKATVCAPDGQGPLPDGGDCELEGKACWNGSCSPRLCTGSFTCDGSLLKQCRNNGTLSVLWDDCEFASLCDAAGAKCTLPTCTPGAFACNGSVATRCKADGSGYAAGGTDCALSNKVCDGGGCLPKACTPKTYFCAAGSPQYCGESGGTYTPADTCSVNEYCSEGTGYCLTDKCTANAAVCNGNLATTCQSDGSGPVVGGTDCAAMNQVCEAGACKPVVCTSGTVTCQGEAVYVCNANGTGTTLSKTCLAGEFCDATLAKPACSVDICASGGLGCDGEVVSTCGANGGSWTAPGTNCKLTSQVCVTGGTCAAEEIAVQGTTTYGTTSVYSQAVAAAFRVLTPRKLTKLEVQASFAGLQKLTWVIYEKRPNAETFDLVHQQVTAQTQPALAGITSPTLDFTFEKGKTYAVGVHFSGTATVSYQYSSVAAAYSAKAAFNTNAYATQFGGDTDPPTSTPTPSSTYYKPYVRLTTVLP